MPPRPPSLAPALRRWASTSTSTRASTSAAGTQGDGDASPLPTVTDASVVYVGPLSTTVTRLKRVSLLSCVLTTASAPALATLDAVGGGAAMHPAAQAGVAAAVATFGVFTTTLLHWFTSPYVHRLTVSPSTPDLVTLETRDVLARLRVETLPLSTLTPPNNTLHPQATFRGGASNRLHYVDTDHFPVQTALGAQVCGRLIALRAAGE